MLPISGSVYSVFPSMLLFCCLMVTYGQKKAYQWLFQGHWYAGLYLEGTMWSRSRSAYSSREQANSSVGGNQKLPADMGTQVVHTIQKLCEVSVQTRGQNLVNAAVLQFRPQLARAA